MEPNPTKKNICILLCDGKTCTFMNVRQLNKNLKIIFKDQRKGGRVGQTHLYAIVLYY